MPKMPIGRLVTGNSDIAAAIRAAGSVALDLETYGPRKGDGIDPSLLYTYPRHRVAMKLPLDASSCIAATHARLKYQQLF